MHILINLGSFKIAHYLQNRRKPPREIRCTSWMRSAIKLEDRVEIGLVIFRY
jgi:hypothetical protein